MVRRSMDVHNAHVVPKHRITQYREILRLSEHDRHVASEARVPARQSPFHHLVQPSGVYSIRAIANQNNALQVNGAAKAASIGAPGEENLYPFTAKKKGRYVAETAANRCGDELFRHRQASRPLLTTTTVGTSTKRGKGVRTPSRWRAHSSRRGA